MISFIERCSSNLIVLTSLIAYCLLGCNEEPVDHELWTKRAKTELKPFKQRLMSALVEKLQDGPIAAIEVCQDLAPKIARQISTTGVEVGRTSHKLRNEKNAPREWIKPLLHAYVAKPGKSEPEIVRLKQGGIGYVEPIYVNSMCLVCHGSTISPLVASHLDEQYPKDEARGFEAGDFRGLFWVEFKE